MSWLLNFRRPALRYDRTESTITIHHHRLVVAGLCLDLSPPPRRASTAIVLTVIAASVTTR